MKRGGHKQFDLDSYLENWRDRVDRVLDEVLPGEDSYPESLNRAMRYSVFAGGKRLRPLLCIAGCEAVGGEPDKALKTAAAIEMVHTYSLIHDDLPAMDDDELRRGKPTCHRKFGEAVAILAGDGLLTAAFGVIAADPGLAPWQRNALVAELSLAAGPAGMVAGQVADMESEGRNFALEDVDYIHEHKTAKLIEMSVSAGAMIGGGNNQDMEAVREYGRSLGLAFQITDDVINASGGEESGKSTGTDAARGKAVYPALFGVSGSRERAVKLCGDAITALAGFGSRADPLRAIANYVAGRNA